VTLSLRWDSVYNSSFLVSFSLATLGPDRLNDYTNKQHTVTFYENRKDEVYSAVGLHRDALESPAANDGLFSMPNVADV